MVTNNMFRKVLFGGFNKADVEEYIQTLENEIDSIKVLHQKEKGEWMHRLDAANEEIQAMQEQVKEAAEAVPKADTEEEDRLRDEIASLRSQLEAAKEEKEKWMNYADEGKQDSDEDSKERPPLRIEEEEAYQQLRRENERLKKELEERRTEESYDRAGEDEGFVDYGTIKKVLEDANRNARLIEEEARQRADELLKEAQEEIKQQKADAASKMDAQLEEKGIQLIAAKYKIEQYAKELCSTQQGIYNIYSRMNKLIENMPVRLDDYWEGEHYRMLEDERRSSENLETGRLEEE